MYGDFGKILNYNGTRSKTYLITETDLIDNSFLLYHFIGSEMKKISENDHSKVIILSTRLFLLELELIMKKLVSFKLEGEIIYQLLKGINPKQCNSNQFIFHDLKDQLVDLSKSSSEILSNIFSFIKEKIELEPSFEWTLIIDNLSFMMYLEAFQPLEMIRFVFNLRDLIIKVRILIFSNLS
jgi:hypothetical protein